MSCPVWRQQLHPNRTPVVLQQKGIEEWCIMGCLYGLLLQWKQTILCTEPHQLVLYHLVKMMQMWNCHFVQNKPILVFIEQKMAKKKKKKIFLRASLWVEFSFLVRIALDCKSAPTTVYGLCVIKKTNKKTCYRHLVLLVILLKSYIYYIRNKYPFMLKE